MSRRFKVGLIVAMVFVAVAVGVQGYLDREASKALAAPLVARERQEAADRASVRGRPPRIEPTMKPVDGDAISLYESIAADRPGDVMPENAASYVARAMTAARQSLTVAPGADVEHSAVASVADTGPMGIALSRPHLATWAASFVGSSLRSTVAKDPAAGLRTATAGLLIAWDGLEFGRIDQARAFLNAAADNLVAARKALSVGVADPAAVADFARVVDALAANPLPLRDAAWEFAVAQAKAAGAESPEGTWESPKHARPGFSWLWSEAIARKEAVDWVLDESATVLRACTGPSAGLRAACEAARERCVKNDNPYLFLVLHVPGETIQWTPEPVVRSSALIETRRAWHERLALARAAAAIAGFAADRHALPRTLVDLVPTHARTVPRDPTTQRDLRYEDGLLWAVGPDGDDDDGRPIDDVAMTEEMPDGDVVWRIAAPTSVK